MANVKIPYALVPAVAIDQRYAHMESAIARHLPRLTTTPIDPRRTLSIACYGPSLQDTWTALRDAGHPIISMSGATKFLAERGVIADYHLDMDPREHKAMTSLPPVPGVKYLVASVCAPVYFDALLAANAEVVLWHAVSSTYEQDQRWVATHEACRHCGMPAPATCGHPSELLVWTGSTIGLAAIHLGNALGFCRFEIHGMDGSYQGEARHAGPHFGKTQRRDITWDAGGVTYYTSKIMANAVAETVNVAKNFPIITTWFGAGLTQALIREANLQNACCADETEKRHRLAMLQPNVIPLSVPARESSFWDGILNSLCPTDLPDLIRLIGDCEPRRATAAYNTGTIPFETAVQLRALTRTYHPTRVVEIGTFIGMSSGAMIADCIETCDERNDCLPSTPRVRTHPKQSSTQMLRSLQEPVDLFFFDGRIQDDDIPEILRLSHPKTVYAFDDYTGHEKGVVNVQKLHPHLQTHLLFPPEPKHRGRTTLAAMVPTL